MAKPDLKAFIEKIKGVRDDALDKNRKALDSAYEARKPWAVAKLQELREANLTATPRQIVALLEKELKQAEQDFGITSENFSSAVMLYVLTVVEVHQQSTGNKLDRGRIVDIMMVVDSAAVKGARKVFGVAMAIATFLPIGRGAKAVKTIVKVGAAVGTAKVVLDKAKNAGKVSDFVISSLKKSLGPAPAKWPATDSFEPRPKKAVRASKKKD